MKARLLDSRLIAYPCIKRGKHALHFHATFAVRSDTSFSLIAYLKSMSGEIRIPAYGIFSEFGHICVSEAAAFSVRGRHVSGDLHAYTHVDASVLNPTLAEVEIRLGFSFCGEPPDEDTIFKTEIPLHIHRGTGPLSEARQ